MPLQLKSRVVDALNSTLSATDKGIDSLVYPILQEHFVEPLKQAMPKPEDITPEQAANLPEFMIDRLFQSIQGKQSFFPLILPLLAAAAIPAVMGAFQSAFGPLFERYLTQQVNRFAEPAIPSPMDLITALHRKLPGLTGTAGDINLDQVYDLMSRAGYDEQLRNMFMDLYWKVPGAQDLISFAVREVYTPEIASAFGQYEGLEDVWSAMAQDAENAGLRKDEFRKYWAAHWVLPSIGQGFEMLHRRIIDPDTLDRLLVALDVMPWWRDRLKAMSYSPLTRVDVRRMHKLGILNRDQVRDAYRDLGYDETNAEYMTRFTEDYNADPAYEDQDFNDLESAKARELTKTDVLRAYKDNMISRDEALDFLESLGYDADNAALLVAREDFRKQQDTADEYVKLIHEGYLKDVYNRDYVIDSLNRLNLPPDYIDQLLDIWDIEQELKATIPTKAELTRFYKKGIITEQQFRTELLKRKYTPQVVDWYTADAGINEGEEA